MKGLTPLPPTPTITWDHAYIARSCNWLHAVVHGVYSTQDPWVQATLVVPTRSTARGVGRDIYIYM